MRFNHNKKRNTAFLFETLVRELTKSVVSNDLKRKQQIINIIKEFFSKGKVLGRELQLYKAVVDCHNVTPRVAEKILSETKKQYSYLDKKQIFNKQSALIKEINKNLSKEVYTNFVADYKMYATLCQIMTTNLKPQEQVLLEEGILNRMTKRVYKEAAKPVPLNMLTYKTFVSKFNDKYGDLNESQKTLLNKYIASFSDNGLEFKLFLNEEISRLKQSINEAMMQEEAKNDNLTTQKLGKVLGLIEDFRHEKVNAKLLEKILKIQALANEVL